MRHSPIRLQTVRAAGAGAARVLARIADAWLPRRCALCDAPLEGESCGLCAGCEADLPGVRSIRCPRCASVCDLAHAASPVPCCANCAQAQPAYDRTIVLADYAPPLDRLIIALKFHGEIALARPLGLLLAARLRELEPTLPELIAAVPPTPQRLAQRGFDQSAEIAATAARRLGVAFAAGLLERVRETRAQSTLGLALREANVAGALRARRRIEGRFVAVVDDVMTSGATLQAAAQALRDAGACRVLNLVAARTP